MMVFLLIAAVCFLVYMVYLIFFWQWRKNCQPFYNEGKLIFGHRGSPTLITENTLPSFYKAIDQGVDGLELDIRLSKDKKLIVFHDEDLKRLSVHNEKIKECTLEALRAVQLHKQENQTELATIPSLNDIAGLLDTIKVLNIEIKSESIFSDNNILKPLIKFLNNNQIDDKCIISSFNPFLLMRLRMQRPQTIIGFLYNRNRLFHGWDNIIWMLRVQPESLHIHYSLLNHWIVKWARRKGLRINSYTINDKKVFDAANIDGVFTDNIKYIK